jgi:YVTN family beta-propeller protein
VGVDFRILGPLEVTQHGRSLVLGGAQQRALLAVLLIHRGEVLSTDRLIDELWGERAPSSAIKIVQGYISQLRKALGDDLILTRGHGYLLAVESERVDACRFEALVAGGHSALAAGDAASADRRLGEALALWRGEPLADFAYERFAQGEIARLGQARLAALEDRIDARLALGEHARMVGELEALVREHPLRERLVGQLMVALYRSGRQADALESYRVARRRLVDELGLEPGRELQELERAILAQDPALDAPVRDTRVRLRATARPARRGGLVIAAGAAVLLVVLIAAAVRLAGSGTSTVRVAPNSLAAIDTDTNRVVRQVAVGTRPGAIAFGSGSLWVANLDDQTISRVDPTTLRTLRTIPVPGPPTGIAAAAGGVWVVVSSATVTSVSARRIDPQFDRIGQKVTIGTVVPGSPGAVAALNDQVWVAPYSGELTRLAARTGRIVGHVDPNAAPGGIDVGGGAAWMTDSFAGNVIRVDNATGLVTPLAVGPGPSGIAVGGGGVWVAVRGADKVVRIDPGTRAVTDTIAVGRSPTGVSVGAGSVWVANSGDGTVTRIDPATNQPIARIAVGGSPHAITIAAGRAWVTVDAQTIPSTKLASGGAVRVDSPYDFDTTDPALAYDPLLSPMLYATCAKLLNYPDKAGLAGSELVPEVAESLPARSADGKTYTFTIRSGFRFSPPSTERVTAQTFKQTIERTLNPAMKSPAASGAADIVGAGAYMAGKAAHIAGVTARANTLTIRLTDPAPNLPTRLAQPAFCAVPSNTPIERHDVIPSAGPYRVASFTPNQGVVLTRNPSYHGSRPHRVARIELAVGIPGHRAIAQVEDGTADYAMNGAVDRTNAATLAARYGPHSPAAKSGHQQYFVNPQPALDVFALNTHRPLFADARIRQAVNYAIDRAALARLGNPFFGALPADPTDHYLPPGIPGHVNGHIYPLVPDLTKARRLAKGHASATAVLYTFDRPPFTEQAQIIKNDLAAIDLRVVVKAFGDELFTRLATPGEPFDIAYAGWGADYPDPTGVLDPLLQNSSNFPPLDDPSYRAKLRAAARLSGPERYLGYARLDRDLARNAAPLAAYDNPYSHELFSARMGCQTYGFYGIDLAALCIKRAAR